MQGQNASQYAGRVHDVLSHRDDSAVEYPLYHGPDDLSTEFPRDLQKTPLSELFFSRRNLDAVQEGIRWRVYVQSGDRKYVISKQPDRDVIIVMRSIYLQHSRNDPNNLLSQVKELNGMVLDYCARTVVENVDMYIKHQRDISQLPIPIDRGQMATNKGTKVLEIQHFF